MKKIIILITMLCSFGFCKIDYNKVLPMLGYNCKIEKSMSKIGYKAFFCDSGYIVFDFNSEEIFVNYKIKAKHKKSMMLLFNRGWTKNNNQIHREKSVIALGQDEFDEPVYGEECKWNGDLYDFYEKFKNTVYYVENNIVEPETNNDDEKIETKQPTYEEQRIAQIMEKYK